MNSSFQHADLITILQGTAHAVIELDGRGKSLGMNSAAAEMIHTLGHEPQAVLGKAIWDLFSDVKDTVLEQKIQAVLAYNVPMQYEFFSPVDQHWYETRAYPTSSGAILTFRDITHRKWVWLATSPSCS